MKNVRTFQGSVASDMESLRGFIAEAMGEIASYIPDRDLQYDIRLIIDELMVNGAGVVCGGVQTENATVYLIDQVLIPEE